MANRRLLFSAAALAVAVAAYATILLPRAFLPPFNEGTLTISLQYNPGISLARIEPARLACRASLMGVPEMTSVGRRTGRAELDEHAEGVHFSEIDVDLKRSARVAKDEVVADIRSRLAVLPASLNVGQPISHRLDHMLSGIRAEIALKIFGDDLDTCEAWPRRSGPARVDPRSRRSPGRKAELIPQLRIEADHERAALYGITPAALTRALEGMSNGRTVSQVVTEGNRRFDVVIRLSDTDRSTAGLGNLLIATPSGHVPLRLVARVEETEGPNRIFRENGQRRIAVYANSDGTRDLAQIVADIRRIVGETAWPQGYVTRLEGSYQAQEEATLRIGMLSLVSLAMIFVVLQSRYRSPVLALIIMGCVPLALIGSVVALWIAGQPLSVASMMGFVTLAGISTRNGILKISRYINLAMHEGEASAPTSSFAAASIVSRRFC